MSSELESDRAMVLNLELREPMVLPLISMRPQATMHLYRSTRRQKDSPLSRDFLRVMCICL
jgi:hypothetical protein